MSVYSETVNDMGFDPGDSGPDTDWWPWYPEEGGLDVELGQ